MEYYFLQVIILQAVFILFYDLFLQKNTYYQWNRVYLLGTSFFSLLLPLLHFGMSKQNVVVESLQPVIIGSKNLQQQLSGVEQSQTSHFFWILYGLGVLISFAFFMFNLIKISRKIKQGEKIVRKNHTLIVLDREIEAFSFYRYVFISKTLLNSEHKSILKHELLHLKQKHWIDLLLFELLKIVLWFNPFIYQFHNRIKLLHEYLADKAVLQQTDLKSYFNRLIQARFSVQNISFVNQIYNPSQIKKRIIMQKRKTSKANLIIKSVGFVILMMALLVLVDACNTQTGAPKDSIDVSKTKDTTVELKNGQTIELKAEDGKTTKINVSKIDENDNDNDDDVEVAFQFMNNPPVYPGCEGKEGKELKKCMSQHIQKFVGRNFNTDIAGKLGLDGERIKILTMFTIDKTGKISRIKARSKYKKLEEEAKRVIALLPNMKPGEQKGKAVNVTYTLPIIFKIEE